MDLERPAVLGRLPDPSGGFKHPSASRGWCLTFRSVQVLSEQRQDLDNLRTRIPTSVLTFDPPADAPGPLYL